MDQPQPKWQLSMLLNGNSFSADLVSYCIHCCEEAATTVERLLTCIDDCHNVSSEHWLLCRQNNSFDVQYNQDVMLLSKCYCLVRSFCRV